jgi:hypothetical protein
MTEQELLVDCLRRLNGVKITYYLTGSMGLSKCQSSLLALLAGVRKHAAVPRQLRKQYPGAMSHAMSGDRREA